MDLQIIISSIVSFFLFLILHIIIFSKIDQSNVLVWIVKLCLFGAIFPLLFALFFSIVFPIGQYPQIAHFLIVFSSSFLLYSLLAIGYILGMFGLLESSLRIKILQEIATAGKRGIQKKEIHRVYNRDVIIVKRLKRFIRSGDISYRNGLYTMRKRFTYFVVHAFIFESMKKLYKAGVHER